MSLKFDWSALAEKKFTESARQQLDAAFNETPNAVVSGRIQVVGLSLGNEPPQVELEDITELSLTSFKALLNFRYRGDAHIAIRTRVLVNSLSLTRDAATRAHLGALSAHCPLYIPIWARFSKFNVDGKLSVGIDAPQITIHLRNNPLQNIEIESSFDVHAGASHAFKSTVESSLLRMFDDMRSQPITLQMPQ